jgi:polyisoprenoid-binding protein YceI
MQAVIRLVRNGVSLLTNVVFLIQYPSYTIKTGEEKMTRKILAVLAVGLVIAMGVVAYSVFRTPEEASGPIQAIPITTEVAEPTLADTSRATATETTTAVEEVEPAVEAGSQEETAEEAEPALTPETQARTDVTSEPDEEAAVATETVVATPGEANGANGETATSPITFEIVQADSEARFLIDEVLRGNPNTVVGVTDQVAGQFAVNPNDLSTTQIGIIRVNARTLATDNDFRNRAIKNQILLTDDYEFVTFTPLEVIGLPERGAVGEAYTFQIVGDLTITDVTRQVTFDVTATPTSETRIEGMATTAFPYTDFELFIPEVRAVDAVEDEVRLELNFVAAAENLSEPG